MESQNSPTPESTDPPSPSPEASPTSSPANSKFTPLAATQPDSPLPPLRSLNRPKRPIWPVLILGMVVVVGFVGWRAWRQTTQLQLAEESDEQLAQLPVRVVTVETAPIQGWITSDGQVEATRGKHLTFEANGEITYLMRIGGRFLREGDPVRAGQLLAAIDDRSYRSDIRSTQADVVVAQRARNQSESRLVQAKSELKTAQSDLKAAQATLNLAKSELKRYEMLLGEDGEGDAIAISDVDVRRNDVAQAQANFESAQFAVESAEQGVKVAQDDVLTQEAQIVSAGSQFTNARIAREDTQLISPINGVVSFLNIREGDYWTTQRLQASGDYQNIVESVPIIVVDPNDLEVTVELPAFQGSRIKRGQRVYVVPDARMSQATVTGLTNQMLVDLSTAQGNVFAVNPAVTPGGRATEVRIDLTSGVANVRVGAKVSVWIEAENVNTATVVPFGAFIFRDRVPYVFVVNPRTNRVERRAVEIGIEGLQSVEVISGINPGELVVTEGRNRLVDGAAVEVVDETSFVEETP
ncbi:MAG: efflux RND transporter periplasmic adaptor subunit [Spirulinaceae cyanobacterium]